jgi:transglutaminase-like putative cysteine protease
MYDIRQFKPALYFLVFLGFSGFALAAESPDLWVLSATALALNAWLIKTRRFTPIPHWLATLITVLALLVLCAPLKQDPSRAVFVIGQFLVALQVVKLYEQRGNRDYAQLLVLSLLLMVAASINTASLFFGVMLIAYLFLSLYCCLLFHLKVETDFAKAAIGVPENINPATLRQDQRFLTRSMRRLTFVVSSVAVFMAIVVFLLFPRGTGAGLLGPLQFKPSETLSGFNDTVSFQRIAQISQNNQEIARARVWKDGVLQRGTQVLLLRGLTLDVYTGDDDTRGAERTWERTHDLMSRDVEVNHDLPPPRRQSPRWKQQITLDPTGTQVLFAMPGLCRVDQIATDSRPRYSPSDEVLESTEGITQEINYVVESTGHVLADPYDTVALQKRQSDPTTTAPLDRAPAQSQNRTEAHLQNQQSQSSDQSAGSAGGQTDTQPTDADPSAPTPQEVSNYDPAIEAFARRPAVSGVDAAGPLAARRKKSVRVDPLDPMIAQNICNYLQKNFTYTLDLTDAAKAGDRDPLVAFLYDFKRGHCEYFAGAMTLMCQSLGMQARMVVGFKCDEYNTLLNQYVIRQSQAHAWVEVLGPDGEWATYDPTSGRGADQVLATTGLWRRATQLFQFLEYTWADSVVAYDRDSRANLITSVDRSLNDTAANSSITSSKLRDWISGHVDSFAARLTPLLIAAMIAAIIASIFVFLLERWRLSRRAKRIGLDDLPASDQLRLVRQLGFYDDLLRLLERHEIIRPRHLTPLEFSRSIEFLPSEVFDSVHRLTAIFYRVRYGRHELTPGQQRHLAAVITRLNVAMQGG